MDQSESISESVSPSLRVGFILSPQFSLLPFSYLIESLRHAADEADLSRQIYCSWRILAPNTDPIFTSCGFSVIPTGSLENPTDYDYIIVVGGLLPQCLELAPEAIQFIEAAAESNVSIAGVCVGSFILAEMGLLNGKQCAIHFYHLRDFQTRYPYTVPVSDKPVIEQDNILTCPGGSAALNLATLIVERHCGRARAVKGMRSMLVNKNIVSTTLPSHNFAHLATCGDWRVESAIDLMEQNVATNLSIEQIADKLMVSKVELSRAFSKYASLPPSLVYRNIRMSNALWLLLNTTRTITQIAYETGFADGAHFSRWFKKIYGESPKKYQQLRRDTKL